MRQIHPKPKILTRNRQIVELLEQIQIECAKQAPLDKIWELAESAIRQYKTGH